MCDKIDSKTGIYHHAAGLFIVYKIIIMYLYGKRLKKWC